MYATRLELPSATATSPPSPSHLCLSPQGGFEGGGTYFPAASADVDGILLRPSPGHCLMHDGNIKHAGGEVLSGKGRWNRKRP